jgi:hypothetical protein
MKVNPWSWISGRLRPSHLKVRPSLLKVLGDYRLQRLANCFGYILIFCFHADNPINAQAARSPLRVRRPRRIPSRPSTDNGSLRGFLIW